MKKMIVIIVCFLCVTTVTNLFSQTSQSADEAFKQADELANQLAKSPEFLSVQNATRALSKDMMANVRSRATDSVSKESIRKQMEDIKANTSLSEQQKADSMRVLSLLNMGIPKARIDSIENLNKALYKAFPQLHQLPSATAKMILMKASTLTKNAITNRSAVSANNEYDKVFTKTEHDAEFPGGAEAWKKYLERNLNRNVAMEDGAPSGSYTVTVKFIVDMSGAVSNVQAVDVPKACPSCGKEAIKIIARGPKWQPAIQNGRNVVFQAVQFITFFVAPL